MSDNKFVIERLLTPYKDINGNDIYVGDIIRFYACVEYGYSKTRANSKYTEMIDLVEVDEDEFYATNISIGAGSYLWRCAEYCEVIGNEKDNPEIIEREKKLYE
jgi:hypothetical protein